MSAAPGPQDVFAGMLLDLDAQRWSAVQSALADVVRVDYTSLAGGEPEEVPAEELVGRWREVLSGFAATQHHLGPLVLRAGADEVVRLSCAVRGHHYRAGSDDPTAWLVAGSYDVEAARSGGSWRLSAITLNVTYQAGDAPG